MKKCLFVMNFVRSSGMLILMVTACWKRMKMDEKARGTSGNKASAILTGSTADIDITLEDQGIDGESCKHKN